MLKSLGTTLAGIALLVGVLLLVLKKGVLGAGLVFIVLGAALYGVTFLSELVKLFKGKYSKKADGKKVQD